MSDELHDLIDDIESNEIDDVITTDSDDDHEAPFGWSSTDTPVRESTDVPNNNEVPTTPIVEEPKAPSKMTQAKEVYARLKSEGKARKDIIKVFIDEIGLTSAGAATYYQKLSKV